MIVNQSPFHEFAQPCIRGKVKKPCMNCYQCFRKSLLERVTMNRPLDNQFLDKLFNIEGVKNVINTTPVYFENVLAYITARSEEHTSELQSRFELVCRLLLEKKKIILQ